MMTTELVTGSAGTDHVSSADDGSMFASVFGEGRYAVKQGDNFAATMGSANSVTIGTGACFIDGRYIRVTSAETLSIDSGSQGANRIDLVGVRYVYSGGVETGTLAVVKGTATGGEPSIPTYTDGNILEGATEAFFPLWSIRINGIVPDDPEKLFNTMGGTVNCPWPVGSVLQMTNATNPNDVYPGTTWQKIQGAFLLGSSSSHALGSTGGAETVTLTSANMPAHTHTYNKANSSTGSTTLTEAQVPKKSWAFWSRLAGSSQNVVFESGNTTKTRRNSGASTNILEMSGSSSVNMDTIDWSYGGGGGHSHTVGSSSANTGSTGSGTAVDKMPPFRVVNMWERTA